MLVPPTHTHGLLWWLSSEERACQAGDVHSIPGQEDLLEKEMATHSIILAWEIYEQRSLAGKVHGITRVGHDLVTDQPTNIPTHTHTHTLTAFPWWTPWAPAYHSKPVSIITHPWPSQPWHVL